jgi:hypothetical protein
MKKAPFRHHGSQSNKCSVMSMFMLVWIFIMGLAGTYMFHFHRLMSSKVPPINLDESHHVDESNIDVIEVKRNPSKALFQTHPVISAPEPIRVVPELKPKPKPEPKPEPAQEVKAKAITLIRKPNPLPKEKLKLKDMWPMSVTDQRQYLQDLRIDDPEPTDKAANEFIAYAAAAAETPVPPSIWDVPDDQASRVANSKPGDTVQYKIAGKTVNIPYGFPEESIFILTASYRDPEAAATIARAYAR